MPENKSDFSPDSYLEKLYQNNKAEFHFAAETKAEWEQWRQRLKEKIAEIIGGLPGKTEIKSSGVQEEKKLLGKITEPEVLEKEEFKNFFRIRIAYQVQGYLKIPAYLLIPKLEKNRFPALVIAHGHGNGSRETVGLTATGEELAQATCHNNLALNFVKAGYLVIVPELIGFGDRRLKEDYQNDPELEDNRADNSCYQISSRLLLFGETILKYRLWDLISAVDILSRRKDVLNDEISVVGFSGGAPAALITALFEERVRAAVISGYTSYYKDSIMARRHCLDNYLPGILRAAELPTIISALAPVPLLIQAAEKDSLFPLDSAEKGFQEIKNVYNFLNQQERLKFNLLQGAEHSVEAAPIIEFLNELN